MCKFSSFQKEKNDDKEKYEKFIENYNIILSKLKNLANSKDSKKLNEISSLLKAFEKDPNTHQKLMKLMKDYQDKMNHIQTILAKHNNN